MRTTNLLSTFAVLALAGCTGSGGLAPPPGPEEIPSLEAAFAAAPGHAEVGLLLAAGYRAAGEGARAATVVAELRPAHPRHPGLAIMDGLLHEDAGAWAEARARYEEALALGLSNEVAAEVQVRLEAVRLEQLKDDVRRALAREAELQGTLDGRTVGVFPFAYEGDDPQWEPLRFALAELLITDLGITGRLRVVERVQVQTLLDELALGESGLVETETAARSGRILGSRYVVQGRFAVTPDTRIDLDAAVVRVGDTPERVPSIQAQDALERLFDLEKELALDLHAQMGIELTPAERARIDERPTRSIQALLAFGRGLAAEDRGEYAAAAQHFAEAARIDPSFSLAAGRRQRVAERAGAARSLQERAAFAARRRQAVRTLRDAPAAARARILRHMTQKQRAVLAEVLGQDRLGTAVLLELVFRRPGGGL